nr:FIST N-terminal domain-containing protein [Paraburkholderia sp. NMBU_R16]
MYFGATGIMQDASLYAQLRADFPCAQILGCSTGTHILGCSVQDEGAVGVAISFASTRVRLATASIEAADQSWECGVQIATQLLADDLAAVFVLSDGLATDGTALAAGMSWVLPAGVPVSGALAADGARFGTTLVGANEPPGVRRIGAVGLYGQSVHCGYGSAGGWDLFGPLRRVTASRGNVLLELDGEPALDLYERYLGDEACGLPATGLYYPLNIHNPADPDERIVRTLLGVDRHTRSLTFAGSIADGATVQLMRGCHERLVDGAALAANRALGGMDPAGHGDRLALLVSCVGRRLLMGQRCEDEVEAVSTVLGAQTSQIGFYSYGELTPGGGSGNCELQNQTMTITCLTEEQA